jgi:WD40 repeat protein
MADSENLSVKSSALSVERSASPPVDAANPWLGLASFTEESRAYFHGRDEEIAELARRVQRKLLTVLFGQSGLGKTSILRAGVVPKLRTEGYCPVYVRIDYGGNAPAPSEQVRQAVIRATADAGTWTKPEASAEGETLWEFLHHRDDVLRDASGRTLTPLIIFDQFEEIFTLAQGDEAGRERAARFKEDLADLVENRAPKAIEDKLEQDDTIIERFDFARSDYRLLISLREDYLPHLDTLKGRMPSITQNRMRLARMTGAQALEAVVKPGGALVTEDVARAIVEFVAGARGGSIERLAELDVEPPLLSVICRELNDRRRALGQAQITAEMVTGNRREILTDFYERSVADLPEGMRRFVEDKLLTKSGFRDNLALEMALEEPGVTKPLIDTLVSRRLLRIEDRLGTQRVELTHDVLADVVRASRDARQQRLLLQDAEERERLNVAAAERRGRRMRLAIGGLVAAVVALSIGAVFGVRAQRRSVTQASQSDFLLGSRALDEGKVAEGLAYLVRAGRKDSGNPIVAPRILTELAARNFFLPATAPLALPSATLRARFTADGKRVLVHGTDKVLRVIDVQTWTLERELRFAAPVATGGWTPASQNPDVVAVWLENGTFVACDVRTGNPMGPPIARLAGSTSRAVALSPDGQWLADRVSDGIGLWSAAGELRTTIPASANSGYGFNADGRQIATYFQGAQSWSVPDGAAIGAPMATPTAMYGRYYSSDGKQMVVVYSRTVQAYDILSGEPAGPALDFDFIIRSSAISADNSRLLVTGDRHYGVVDLARGSVLQPMIDMGGPAADATSSKDGRVVLTCSTNGFFNLWDSTTGKLLAEPSFKQRGFAPAALSPDGTSAVAFTAEQAHLLRVTQGAAQPLVLPRAPSVALVNLVRGAPTRIAWATPTHFKAIDAATGRVTSDGFAWPSRILGPAGSMRSTHGSLFGAGESLVVITKQAGASRTWRGWTVGQHGIQWDVELQDVPADVTRFRPSHTGGIAAASGAAASRSLVGVWDLESGRRVANFQAPEPVNEILTTISPDRRLVAFRTATAVIRIGDISSAKVLCALQLTDGSAALQVFRFTPDSRQLVTGDDWGGVQVWEARSGKLVKLAQPHRAAVRRIDLSADHRHYVTLATDNSMQAWDSTTHQPYGELLMGTTFSTGGRADFSSDNKRLVTGAAGDTARVWDIGSGLPLTPGLSQSGDLPNVVAYGPDGRFVEVHGGTGGGTTRIRMWAAPPDGRGAKTPAWLLDLATLCGGQRLTDDGKLESILKELGKMAAVRSALDALPADDPYGMWASWFLSETTSRPIAPGFKIIPRDATKLAEAMAAEAEQERKEQRKVTDEIASVTPRATQLRVRRAWSELEPLERRLTELIRIRDGDGTVAYETALANLSLAVFRNGKPAEAEPIVRELLGIRETRGAAIQLVANTRGLLGLVLSELKRNADAEPLLAGSYDAMNDGPAGFKTEAARALAKIYADANRPTEAAEWEKKAAGARLSPQQRKQPAATKSDLPSSP